MGQNEIQRPGLNEILRRSLTIKGDLPPASVLGAEIVPVVVLESDRPEYLYLGGERKATSHIDVTAVAAQWSKVAWENPLGSGLIAVMDKITVERGTVGGFATLWIGTPETNLTTILGGAPTGPFGGLGTDFRWSVRTGPSSTGLPTSSCRTYFQIGAATVIAVTEITDINIKALDFADFCDRTGPLVLPQGWKLIVQADVVNAGMCVEFTWRERQMEPNEPGINAI